MRYLTVSDVQERWNGISGDTVRRYIASGQLKAVKIGRSWRIKPSDLEKFEREKQKMDEAELHSHRVIRV